MSTTIVFMPLYLRLYCQEFLETLGMPGILVEIFWKNGTSGSELG